MIGTGGLASVRVLCVVFGPLFSAAVLLAGLGSGHSRARHDFASDEISLESSLRSPLRFARGTMPAPALIRPSS